MALNEKPLKTTLPDSHYIFIEKVGPFMDTAPKCWTELHQLVPLIERDNEITGYLSLYKVEPNKMTYRAGVALSAPPVRAIEVMRYEKIKGGNYNKFVLTGSYAQLPEACGRVFSILKETQMAVRDDFNIENYVNSPKDTPEDKLITEILIPVP
jgi:DNA gyrase inhibitor GyrI